MTNQHCSIVRWDGCGRGVAEYVRPDGHTIPVAVPGSIVGERVEIGTVVKTGKGSIRHEACLVGVETPSPHRAVPRCPHVPECGGCVWQHIDAQYQAEIKQQQVAALFQSIGVPQGVMRPIITSAQPWHYRNKMEFSFSQDRSGKQFLGLFRRNQRRSVFNLDVCFLTQPWMAETLKSVRQWWHDSLLAAYRPSTDEGSLQTVTMRDSATMGDRMVILTVSGNPTFALREHHLADFVTHVQRSATPLTGTLSIILRIRQIAKKMPTQFYEMVLFGPDYIREELTVEATASVPRKLCFHISPQAFFQPNTFQAMNIYSHALQLAALKQDDVLFDLYCGIGIFGMFASLETRQAVGIELSRESAYDAKTNAQRLGLSNFSIHCGDTAAVVASLKNQGTFARPSTVIVDPPRAGLSPRALDEITSLQPSIIVYVSCNPESQARDAVILMQRGWSIEALQPVDQFPQTAHVENIMLARKG